jgi:uncharacterized membrane protein YkgB
MIQFYFLSIFFNALAGFVLFTGGGDEDPGIQERLRISLNDETFRLILGILTVVTGILKLLSPVQGDIPVIGDLLPAAAGFVSGLMLIFSYYQEHRTLEAGRLEQVGAGFLSQKKWIGLAVMIAAALHFLFPQALLL